MEELPSLQSRLYQVVSWNQDGEAIPDLVRDGAQVDYVHPSYGHTALHNACKCDRPRAIEMLLKHGADPTNAKIDSFFSVWGISTITGIIACIELPAGLIVWFWPAIVGTFRRKPQVYAA